MGLRERKRRVRREPLQQNGTSGAVYALRDLLWKKGGRGRRGREGKREEKGREYLRSKTDAARAVDAPRHDGLDVWADVFVCHTSLVFIKPSAIISKQE
jgi:hypothetical protein